MENENKLVMYAVRNEKGQYFKAKGYQGYGDTWIDDINKARIYGKTGGARGVITWFANHYPQFPTPSLIKLTVTEIEVIDESERIEKSKIRKATALAKRNELMAKRVLQHAERKLAAAQAEINRLKSK
jgi:hypothetical protein